MNIYYNNDHKEQSVYTKFPEMFSLTESLWSILNKMMFINACDLREILIPIINCSIHTALCKNNNNDLYRTKLIDGSSFFEVTGLQPSIFLNNSVLKFIDKHDLKIYKFRYCKSCLKQGFHSIFHQIPLANKCLFHKTLLETACPHCHNELFFYFNYIDYKKPYTCKFCKQQIFEVDLFSKKGPIIYKKRNFFFHGCCNWFDKYNHISSMSFDAGNSKKRSKDVNIFTKNKYILINILEEFVKDRFPFSRSSKEPHDYIYIKECRGLKISNNSTFYKTCTYKAIKRHLYKNFVKKHKRCYHKIVKLIECADWHLNGNDDFCFDCEIVLSFIIWRMYWENTTYAYDLFNTNTLKIKELSTVNQAHCLNRWIYGKIFSIECISTFFESFQIVKFFIERRKFILSKHLIKNRLTPYWEIHIDSESSIENFHYWTKPVDLSKTIKQISAKHFVRIDELYNKTLKELRDSYNDEKWNVF